MPDGMAHVTSPPSWLAATVSRCPSFAGEETDHVTSASTFVSDLFQKANDVPCPSRASPPICSLGIVASIAN